jgi:hypothetical protein
MTALVRAAGSGDALDPRQLAARPLRSVLPWTSEGLLRLIVVNASGLGLIFASWYLVSGETGLREQMGWLKLGILGLAVAAGGNGLWLLRGRQTIGLARVALLGTAPSESGARLAAAVEPDRDEPVLATSTMTRFHRRECPMIGGKQVTVRNRAVELAAGRTPCELCRP